MLLIPVGVGELVDKLTILAIKVRHLRGAALEHVQREQQLLQEVLDQAAPRFDPALQQQLQQVNGELWQVEDALRDCEQRSSFGPEFVALARSVYRLNDRRAALKRAINLESHSPLIEEKSYGQPSAGAAEEAPGDSPEFTP